jgi:3D (Asp-Asp-Asp) domain-containing protein
MFGVSFLANVATADMVKPISLVNENQNVSHATIRVVSAYNVGDPNQTDDTPCIAANGEDICKALLAGEKRCAANFVPLGTVLHVETVGVCLVTDRMNKRYRNHVDIAMQLDEYQQALQFGRKKLKVKILDDGV